MQVRVYDVETMSCSYVLAGHKEVVLSLDTCVSSSGNVLVVTGSKDKTVSPSTYLVVLHNSCSFEPSSVFSCQSTNKR